MLHFFVEYDLYHCPSTEFQMCLGLRSLTNDQIVFSGGDPNTSHQILNTQTHPKRSKTTQLCEGLKKKKT